jgi:hypothetical protein
MKIVLPTGPSICRVSIPDDLPRDRASLLAVAGLNAVSAAKRRRGGPPVVSDAAYAEAAIKVGLEASAAGSETWNAWSRKEASFAAILERLPSRNDEPSVVCALSLLLIPSAIDDPLVTRYARLILGHSVGTHDEGCRVCDLYSLRAWKAIITACQRNERTILHLWYACVEAGLSVSKCPTTAEYAALGQAGQTSEDEPSDGEVWF